MSLTTAAAVPGAPAQCAPVTGRSERLTRFRIKHSTFMKLPLQPSGVDAEFHRYTSSISDAETDTLWFWEVSELLLVR